MSLQDQQAGFAPPSAGNAGTDAAARPGSGSPHDLDLHARMLEESGRYRVLRRLAPSSPLPLFRIPGATLALFVDCETTGLDPYLDEVIELAVVPFQFTEAGRIVAIHEPLSQLRQPSRPIPAQVTRLTGIDDAAVAGRSIDETALRPLLAAASLVVAHHAAFDRPFLERLMPEFADLPWGCSLRDVPWRDEGVAAQALPVLAAHFGFFYEAHRALDDCVAAIEVLGRSLPTLGRTAIAEVARRAAAETRRIHAVGSPYAMRDVLKRRGYRWANGADGRPRCWHVEVEAAALEDELRFLADAVGLDPATLPVSRVTAYERHSVRG